MKAWQSITCVVFTPDSQAVAWGEENGTIRIRTLKGRLATDLKEYFPASDQPGHFSRWEISGAGYADGLIRIWQDARWRAAPDPARISGCRHGTHFFSGWGLADLCLKRPHSEPMAVRWVPVPTPAGQNLVRSCRSSQQCGFFSTRRADRIWLRRWYGENLETAG